MRIKEKTKSRVLKDNEEVVMPGKKSKYAN